MAERAGLAQPAGMKPVGGGDGEKPDLGVALAQPGHGLDRLGQHGAGGDDGDLRARRRLAQPIGAGGHLGLVQGALGLLDGAGREPEIDRAAAFLLLQMIEGPAEDRGQLIDEGGLEHGEARLAEADQRAR